MPYYSELGLSTPTSSGYSLLHLSGPYSNHSSIIASNYTPSYTKTVRGPFRGGFKPHLSTISELNSPLRASPNLYYKSSPKITLRPIKTINTADIDVSKNRLRKFEKYERPKTESLENIPVEKTPTPKRIEPPQNSVQEREAKPNKKIRRDRPTVRLQTVHTDALEKEIVAIKSWRDNFEPDELGVESKRTKKSPGEILKDKFLIRSRSKENLLKSDHKPKRKVSVKKSPSFHEICEAITSGNLEDELNPGQPVEVRRKQSRQLSTETVLREIRRKSTDLSEEHLQILDAILSNQQDMQKHEEPKRDALLSRESVRKKRGIKKKIPDEEKVSSITKSPSAEKITDVTVKRRPKKKIKSSSNLDNIEPNQEVEQLAVEVFENTTRDISQVDIEETKFKPKPVIKASVGEIEQSKPILKAVIDEVEVQVSPKKPEKKFRFNVIVEVQEESAPAKRKSVIKPSEKYGPKIVLSEEQFGKVQTPSKKELVISSILKNRPTLLVGQELEQKKKNLGMKLKLSENQNIRVQFPKALEPVVSNIRKEARTVVTGNILQEKKLKIKPVKPDNEILNVNEEESSTDKLNSPSSLELKENRLIDSHKDLEYCARDENDDTSNAENANMTVEKMKKMVSKRSLVQKADKDDPDLKVFTVPEPETPEPEPEEETESNFVPLQSNRLSAFMHPWKKPEQFDVCPVEIFARPKLIRGRHYPRPRGHPAAPSPAPPTEEESSNEEEDDEEESEDSSSEGESSSEEEGRVSSKIGTSTSSSDSGFGSGAPCKNIDSLETRDSPTHNHANNPAFALDSEDIPEEYSQSSTYRSFQSSGRITPPATTIPRFRKYCLDDFNFLKVLGKGSFGKVLLAELKGTEYYYAVKCLKKDVVLEDDDVECTLIERKVLALGTKHPFLCHLLCTFQTESHLFFVMEYLNGGDMMFHIQASGGFPEHQARFYGAEIVSGLKFLHNKGIVYRDLKLDNVLLDFDGHVRIADFGMCKLQIFLDRMAETFCGTPDYMAPEIIKGQHYNQNVDWWSFGVLLYEMLLGQSPFSGCDEDELFWSICNEKPVLPKFLSAEAMNILTLLLEKDASKRLGNRFCPHGDIQDHVFFKPIDWPALEARALEAPFKPNLKHPLDTQYFDKHFTVEKPKLTAVDATILHSMDQTQFQGFSYTNPNATDQ